MSRIKSKNTKPEKTIRALIWKNGLRYRIHDGTVLGKPDISNKSRKIAIFVDGCFWHGCSRCYVPPKTNSAYWKKKLEYNQSRRVKIRKFLKNHRWNLLELQECMIRESPTSCAKQIMKLWNKED